MRLDEIQIFRYASKVYCAKKVHVVRVVLQQPGVLIVLVDNVIRLFRCSHIVKMRDDVLGLAAVEVTVRLSTARLW